MLSTPASVEELDELISRPSEAVQTALSICPGRFIVLGAGGKMGLHVSQMLQRALSGIGWDEPVMVVSRFENTETRDRFEAADFDVISADLSDPHQVAALPDAENVYFLAGVKFGTSSRPDLLQRMNIDMPRLIADRYRSSRIVALSTGCVYAFSSPLSGGPTEDDPTDPPGDYARSCLGREGAFREASDRYGTRCVLIRLNYSVELRYGVLVDIAQKVLAEAPVSLDMGYANVIWQGDAIAHIIQSLPRANSPPLVLNVTGAEILRVHDVARGFAERLGKEVRLEGTEAPTAWLSNASRSHQMFGAPKVSLNQMMDWIADWLKRGGPTLNKPTHFEVRSGGY